MSET
jgi:hypothetical protein